MLPLAKTPPPIENTLRRLREDLRTCLLWGKPFKASILVEQVLPEAEKEARRTLISELLAHWREGVVFSNFGKWACLPIRKEEDFLFFRTIHE